MTLPLDTLVALDTLLACLAVGFAGSLAIAVLPWRSREITESWGAWSALAGMVRGALASGSSPREAPPRAIGGLGAQHLL